MTLADLEHAARWYVKQVPNFDENYFANEHRVSSGLLKTKVYIRRDERGFYLSELNWIQIALRDLLSALGLGFLGVYQDSYLPRLEKIDGELHETDQKVRALTLSLARKLCPNFVLPPSAPNSSQVETRPPVEVPDLSSQQLFEEWVQEVPTDLEQELGEVLPGLVNDDIDSLCEEERERRGAVACREMARHPIEAFRVYEQWPARRQERFVRLLNRQPQAIVSLWSQEMAAGRRFAQSERERMTERVGRTIPWVSNQQFCVSLHAAKFWEILDLIPEECGRALSTEQLRLFVQEFGGIRGIRGIGATAGKVIAALPVNQDLPEKMAILQPLQHLFQQVEGLELRMRIMQSQSRRNSQRVMRPFRENSG